MNTIIINASESKFGPEDIRFNDTERWDGEPGEYVLEAIGRNNEVFGRIDYSYNSAIEDGLHIDMIDVDPQWRRRGVGTMLVNELQRIYPAEEIDWGLTTPEGNALRGTIGRQAMPVVTLRNDEGLDAKGNVDLYLEKFMVSKANFMSEPQETDCVYRPRGWYGTETNWIAWQQYVQFAQRLLASAFRTSDIRKLTGIGELTSTGNPGQNAAARKVAKMFMRIQEQVLASQTLED